jgi:HEAT repeat protein
MSGQDRHSERVFPSYAAWDMLMGHPAELPDLIQELTDNPDQEQLWFRLLSFRESRSRTDGVIDAILKLMTFEDPKVRAATIFAAAGWQAPEAALVDQVGIALDDPSADVRKAAARFIKRHGDEAPGD